MSIEKGDMNNVYGCGCHLYVLRMGRGEEMYRVPPAYNAPLAYAPSFGRQDTTLLVSTAAVPVAAMEVDPEPVPDLVAATNVL